MVEDRVTDPRRVAQLLASELSGRETGRLARVSVVDADEDAEPSPDGTVAYGVAVDGERVGDDVRAGRNERVEGDGVRAGEVVLYPEAATLVVRDGVLDLDRVVAAARDGELAVDREGEAATVRVETGASTKRAVDAVVAGLG
ncbi:hypothetical protein BRC92_12430 [Halobacteriales archaeon QS_4_69_31]|nr:MAG: hypothetical protein BRC92_12430 [Halobacteriales archaeon QS_4_69_31]